MAVPTRESPADPVAGPVVPRDRPRGAGRPAAADRAAGDEWWPLPDPPVSGRSPRVDTDVDDVERDLVRLVLTVAELRAS